MKTAKEISSEWPEYDKMIALSQLTNYGVIYLDEYNLPTKTWQMQNYRDLV